MKESHLGTPRKYKDWARFGQMGRVKRQAATINVDCLTPSS